LAAVGGSLGVASTEIAGFAESAAQMSVAFELPAEQAATAAAKILNAFQQPINTENMQSLGNVINQIGDSMAATEADVLDFTNRASFLNTTMGLSVTQVATLGGVLISAGLTAETAAGGIKSAMNQLTSTSSRTGGMDNWAALMGVSVDELKDKVAGDLPNALIETANKIAAIEDPVERFQTAVNLAGSEGAPALLKLAGAQDYLQFCFGSDNFSMGQGSIGRSWRNGQDVRTERQYLRSRGYDAQQRIHLCVCRPRKCLLASGYLCSEWPYKFGGRGRRCRAGNWQHSLKFPGSFGHW
jgi:TP901 family phage tail tape measure protein